MTKRFVIVFLAAASIGVLSCVGMLILAPTPAAAQASAPADEGQVGPGLQWCLGLTARAGWRAAGRRGFTY